MMQTKMFVPLLAMLFVLAGSTLAATCGTDKYAPCTCSADKIGSTITCNRITVDTVKTMFSKVKQYYFDYLVITPNSKDGILPAGLIGNHTFGALTINCPSRFTPLVIDPTALTFTRNMTDALTIKNCDLSKLDWSFMKNFRELAYLTVASSSNLHTMFYTFPSSTLTDLSEITLTSVTDLNGFENSSLRFPPILQNGLSRFEISYCYDLLDAAFNRLWTKWLLPSGIDTLSQLIITGTSLLRVPLNLAALDALYYVEFSNNISPMELLSGDFIFRDLGTGQLQPIQFLLLDNCGIYNIKQGSFKGNFSDALVSLTHNYMHSFEEDTYKEMLSQMDASAGFLDVGDVPFDCDNIQCGLMWLLVDNPNYLSSMFTAMCYNGTYFSELNPQDLRTPKGTLCPY